MIVTTNFKALNVSEYDLALAIVRSYKHPVEGVIHVPELSPSNELFSAYLALRDAGKWNQAAFDVVYKPAFIAQIQHDKRAQRMLDRLVELDKQGKRIALVCYCEDKKTCHRSIIARMLRNKGASVVWN